MTVESDKVAFGHTDASRYLQDIKKLWPNDRIVIHATRKTDSCVWMFGDDQCAELGLHDYILKVMGPGDFTLVMRQDKKERARADITITPKADA